MKDIRVLLIIGFVFFTVALLDSIFNDATNFSELGNVGKGATIGFCLVLGFIISRYAIWPLIQAVIKSVD